MLRMFERALCEVVVGDVVVSIGRTGRFFPCNCVCDLGGIRSSSTLGMLPGGEPRGGDVVVVVGGVVASVVDGVCLVVAGTSVVRVIAGGTCRGLC